HLGTARGVEVDDFNLGAPRRSQLALDDRTVGAWSQCYHHRAFSIISRRVPGGYDLRFLCVSPVVIRRDQRAARIAHLEGRIRKLSGDAGQRRTQGANYYLLGTSADDETGDNRIVASGRD